MPRYPQPRSGGLEARVREALRVKIETSRRSMRSLEDEAGLGHGTLSNLLRGNTALRFDHLELLAPPLGVTPAEFLLAVLSDDPSPDAHLAQAITEAVLNTLRRVQAADPLPRPSTRPDGR
jgi:transcriptional regulator with XRE-family HTH domain